MSDHNQIPPVIESEKEVYQVINEMTIGKKSGLDKINSLAGNYSCYS